MSTLISDLADAPAQGDVDFVQNIMNEINGGSGGGGGGGGGGANSFPPVQPPPAVGGNHNGGMISAPNPNSFGNRGMDNAPITAHMIGNSQPTPADFAQMIGQANNGGGNPGPMAAPQGQWAGAAAVYQPALQATYIPPPAKKSWLARTADELRTACFVAILVFLFSLPVVNFLFAHYVPSMVKSTGELTILGLLVKSLTAGAAFWVLQKVVVPLLSL